MLVRAPRVLPCALVATVLLTVGACSGGSDPAEPEPEPPPTPGSVVATAGATAQIADVASAVPEAPAVRVLSTKGQPMAGVSVRFAVTKGGGSVASSNVPTNSDGIASAGIWTLGTEGGENEVTATVGSLPLVRFSATATASGPASLTFEGDGQSATVGTPLPIAPAAVVHDAHGNPVAGVMVHFTASHGSLGETGATASVATDDEGRARVSGWTLGTQAGAQSLSARVGTVLVGSMTATAIAGPVSDLLIISGDGQTGAPSTWLPEAIWVRVVDGYGNPVEGATVEWVIQTGGGSIQQPVSTTDAAGASPAIWTLGQNTGEQQLLVRIEATGASVLVTATAKLTPLIAAAVDVSSWSFARFRCALRESGAIGCSGQNRDGVLGDGTLESSELPVSVAAPGITFSALAVGGYHACALTSGGAAYCWGGNASGAIGDGTNTARYAPVPVVGGHAFAELHSGVTYSCGLKADSTLWCWGTLNSSRLATPTQVSVRGTPIRAVALGQNQICADSPVDGTWCVTKWADPMPLQIAGAGAFDTLAAGDSFACALAPSGGARCWGRNVEGQLGDGSSSTSSGLVAVAGGLQFASISAGGAHACGVTTGGDIYCWGSNESGQLGTGEVGPARVPTPQRAAAPPGVQFRSVSAGYDGTCAVATTGDVFCWGTHVGAVRDGAVNFRVSPAPARVADREGP